MVYLGFNIVLNEARLDPVGLVGRARLDPEVLSAGPQNNTFLQTDVLGDGSTLDFAGVFTRSWT